MIAYIEIARYLGQMSAFIWTLLLSKINSTALFKDKLTYRGVLMFYHIRLGEATRICHQLSSYTVWGGTLIAGGHSVGIMVEMTPAECGNMDFSRLQVPPFL